MKWAVPHTPMATLGAVAPSGSTAAAKGRVTQVVPSDANGVSTIVVAGAPRCGKSSVTNALLGAPVLAAAGALPALPAGALPAPPAGALPAPPAGAFPAVGLVPVVGLRSGPAPAVSPAPGSGPGSGVGPSVVRPRRSAPAVATGEVVVGAPVTSAYVSFRHGEQPRAYAYVPGRRTPRPLGMEQVRAGDPGMLGSGGPGRPPRRVEVLHPAALLRKVSLVDTPGVGGFDQVYAEIVLDALNSGAALLFVAEASTALDPAQLDFLAQVEQRDVAVTFVLTKIDSHPQWPAVLSANQKLVHDHAPRLATAPWYAVSTVRSCDGAPPAGVEEGARGLAGLGMGALRRGLTEPAPGEPSPRPAVSGPVRNGPAVSGPVRNGPAVSGPAVTPTAPRVADGVTDALWTRVLDREIRTYGTAAGQRLAIDLAAVHVRCVQETSSQDGCGRLAYVVDRELHALSLRATRSVEETATAIMRTVFGEILETPPDQAAVDRIRRATRRAVEAAESGPPGWDRALLVTSTAGVAVTAGDGAVASLAAVEPRPIRDALLPPIGVGLSASCYAARHRDSDRSRCRGWLQQTVHTLEIDLGRELAQRFEYLREALTVVAADTVDHGVLLA